MEHAPDDVPDAAQLRMRALKNVDEPVGTVAIARDRLRIGRSQHEIVVVDAPREACDRPRAEPFPDSKAGLPRHSLNVSRLL